jgi:aryl-alcohol dehydrogenase-like predicted oxidoreductase
MRLRISRLSFGTASLHHISSGRARRSLLEAAAASGLTHFDTAPLYGFGMAERELGPLLAAEPGLTVATKVGLYAPGASEQGRASVLMRKALGKLVPSLARACVDLTVQRAELSLGASLRRLVRERVDLLLVHEPDLALMRTDEWQAWLARERARGRIRAAGIAGTRERLTPFLSGCGSLAGIIQTADSLDRREADFLLRANRSLQLTYGYLSAAARSGKPFEPQEVLAQALRRNPTGTVLVSTRRIERLATFGALIPSAS